jgi:hypothetical protein
VAPTALSNVWVACQYGCTNTCYVQGSHVVTLHTYIAEEFGSNLWRTGHPDWFLVILFSPSSEMPAGVIPRLYQGGFIRAPSCRWALWRIYLQSCQVPHQCLGRSPATPGDALTRAVRHCPIAASPLGARAIKMTDRTRDPSRLSEIDAPRHSGHSMRINSSSWASGGCHTGLRAASLSHGLAASTFSVKF